MKDSILFAIQIYFLGFIIAVFMAAMIKGLLFAIRRMSPETRKLADGGEDVK